MSLNKIISKGLLKFLIHLGWDDLGAIANDFHINIYNQWLLLAFLSRSILLHSSFFIRIIDIRCFNQKTAFSKLPSSDNAESCCKLVVVVPFLDKFKEIHERLYIFESNALRIMHTSQCWNHFRPEKIPRTCNFHSIKVCWINMFSG